MAQQDNVIVFLTDQQRWDTSALFGCPLDLTPNYDRAAARGTHLAQCISCQPVCAPARACLQTGLYATANGVWSNGQHLSAEHRGIAQYFAEAGYDTAYFGKWHLNGTPYGPAQAVPANRRFGYKHWLAANVFEFCSQPYRCTLFDEEDRSVQLPGYRTDAVVDAAIRFVHAHQDRPLFVFVSLIEPHHQNEHYDYVPPRGYRERYAGRWLPPDLGQLSGNAQRHAGGYFGCVKRCDEAFGRMLDALESLELSGRTNVLYTADHGCHFNTREGTDKRSCHESSVRVPGALIGPGFDGGGRIDQPVSLIDLPPTLLRAAGIAVPGHFQGHPLQNLLNVPACRRPETDALIQISESGIGRALRTQRWKYAMTGIAGTERGDGTAASYRESHLYDLEHDPYELCNRVADEDLAEVRTNLCARLLVRMAAAGELASEVLPPVADGVSKCRRY